MPLMDEFKEERAQVKDRPFKERLAYFWEYYKWWVIGIVGAIIVIVLMIRSIVTKKDQVLYVAMINTLQVSTECTEEVFINPLLEQFELNPKKNTIMYDIDFVFSDEGNGSNDYRNRELLSVYMAAGEIDIISSDEPYFLEYAYNGFFCDLRDYLSAEELEQLSDYLVYIDKDVLDRYTAEKKANNFSYDEEKPDLHNPDVMSNPIPVGIDLRFSSTYSNQFITKTGDGHSTVALMLNSRNKERAVQLLEYFIHLN